MLALVPAAIAAAVLARLALAVYRFVKLPPAARRHWLPARWARLRWRWLAHNLGLAYIDKHRRLAYRLPRYGTSVMVRPHNPLDPGRLRFPRARFRCDEFGISATVRTVPGVDRSAFDKQAVHIANAWGCHRAQVHQVKPGRLLVRGLRLDPLTLPYPAGDAPPGVYGHSSNDELAPNGAPLSRPGARDVRQMTSPAPNGAPLRLYVGRDEWGADRWLPLPGVTGITVGGLPGSGKTSLINSWLCQLAGLPGVQFVFIDGKGGGDYADWSGRAWISTGDELSAAAAALEDVHALMRQRFGTVLEQTGHRNAWHAPLSLRFPLVVTVLDECHTFFDLDAVKGSREADGQVRACRAMAGQLVRKGRSVLFLTILVTQKQTSDAIPTAIRDNCALGLSFAVKTRDAAVAALGEHIREYPSYCPSTLQDPAYVGVCTAGLRTAGDPFVRIRVPEVTGAAAAARAAETACNRLDPREALSPSPLPDRQPAPVLA